MLETVEGSLPDIVPRLAVWPISSRNIAQQTFQQELHHSCSLHGGRNHQNRMIPCSKTGFAGAQNGTQIPFRDM